jgi:hypothetical protein
MSNQSLDQLTVPSEGLGAAHINEPLITGLSHADWKTTGIKTDSETLTGPKPANDDSGVIHVGNYWGQDKFPASPDTSIVQGMESGSIKYPIHSVDEGQGAIPGEFTLLGLNQKIKEAAVSNVEKNMSDKEREQLVSDAAKYADAMKKYQHQHIMWIGINPPEAPKEPESLRRYDQAVDHEIAQLTKKMENNI